MGYSLNHIINPVTVIRSSDLFIAQPITFESLIIAKKKSEAKNRIRLLTTQFPEDRTIIPDGFVVLADLEKSTQDNSTIFTKKLPFIAEILSRASEVSDEQDYIIYSNVDIAVQPHFYDFISEQIEKGIKAMVINRRTISNKYKNIKELEQMFLETGESHPGFDCFVFPASSLPKFYLDKTILGANWIGRILLLNLIAHHDSFRLFDKEFLTFHIGDDRSWQQPKNDPLHNWNMHILLNFIDKIQNNQNIMESELAQEMIWRTNKFDNKPSKQNWVTKLLTRR